MRVDTQPHQVYGGLDLHARTMSGCILKQAGDLVGHRTMPASPEALLKVMAPSREDVVVAVACLFTWSWLADLCTPQGLPFVFGHALDRKASHGGKAKHDQIDAQKIAGWLRGGLLPPASVYPAELRATRDLLRRRLHLLRTRAERLAHSHKTKSPSTLPAISTKLAYTANREGGTERFPEPAVQQSLAVDLTLLDAYDRLRTALALSLVQMAKAYEVQPFYRLRSIPGVGTILALVLLYELHAIRRFPRVQACVSSGRLVQCAKDSVGKRSGTSGKKMGHADLQWAVSEAAVLCLRHNPAGQKSLTHVERQHGQGKALTILAHQWARAVYDLLKRDPVCDGDTCLRQSRSGVGGPAASRAAEGSSLAITCWQPCDAAS